MSDQLTFNPSEYLAPVADMLATLDSLGITPSAVRVEWHYSTQSTPDIHLRLRYRTDFEALTKTTKRKVSTRAPFHGQKHYYTTDAGPLIQCISFQFHDDWEGK